MKLDQYLAEWRELIANNGGGGLGLPPEVSELYRGFVQSHYLDIFKKVYTRLDEHWDCHWEELRDSYFQEFPPQAWELNHLVEDFPRYLGSQSGFQDYLVDLARYEWAEYSVYTRLTFQGEKSSGGLERGYFLNPAHDFLELSYDIGAWLQKWESQDPDLPLGGRPVYAPNILIISRNPETFGCVMTRCDILDIILYQGVLEGHHQYSRLFDRCQQTSQFTEREFQEKINFLKQQSIIYEE